MIQNPLKVIDSLSAIEKRLRSDPYHYIFSLGNLYHSPDDLIFYGFEQSGDTQVFCSLFTKLEMPILSIHCEVTEEQVKSTLAILRHQLPNHFQVLTKNAVSLAGHDKFQVEKILSLIQYNYPKQFDAKFSQRMENYQFHQVEEKDLDAVIQLLDFSYPNHCFTPDMLLYLPHFSLYQQEQLVAIVGLHVYAPIYEVAVIGNLTVDPQYRHRGHAFYLLLHLCDFLHSKVNYVSSFVLENNVNVLQSALKFGCTEHAKVYRHQVSKL